MQLVLAKESPIVLIELPGKLRSAYPTMAASRLKGRIRETHETARSRKAFRL